MTRPLRMVTAASLFDGHDAAINMMRRLIQAQGVEVIHLGHNRSVDDIVRAAIQEDADAIALSSYQGGHMEFFRYLHKSLHEAGCAHVAIIGGGGGTITPEEITALEADGITRIYHPDDGLKLGLPGMIEDTMKQVAAHHKAFPRQNASTRDSQIAHDLSLLENGDEVAYSPTTASKEIPVIGITGTGGAGKSSLTDELLLRFVQYSDKKIAVLAVDPSRRRTGGALLGDRIRMNALSNPQLFMRSMATRRQNLATSKTLKNCIDYLKSQDFDLIVVETAGIGQSDTEIVDLVDMPLYVMTSEYGAASQLEKIDMLDYAQFIVINKFDKKGSEDALRDVRKQWRRNRNVFDVDDQSVPVVATMASQFNDPGVNWLYQRVIDSLTKTHQLDRAEWLPTAPFTFQTPRVNIVVPGSRQRYLSEISDLGRKLNQQSDDQADVASKIQHITTVLRLMGVTVTDLEPVAADQQSSANAALIEQYHVSLELLTLENKRLLQKWPTQSESFTREHFEYEVRGKKITGDNYRTSLSQLQIPKVATPKFSSWGETLKFLTRENLPGSYPFTAGVFPYRRTGEDPIRMFAGEGSPERTNRRFHYLAAGQPANRLSTAFDSVTLYGEDPAIRPDIYGKIGNSGVSIATLDDMKKLYSGFDLCAPNTSVSMTINGPAPIILAMFVNTAVDQQVETYLKANGLWEAAQKKITDIIGEQPQYLGGLPENHDGLGLGLLGITGDQLLDADTYQRIKADTLTKIRGTVQADILKEDQAQNTCIFSTEFALHMMGDIQTYFTHNQVRNFYSVSISGYHIAEAGANPISQLAFTLANGFTLVEYYLARGLNIDDFAPNLSFFFSNGMDPEYSVIGRVARRIWARAMKERYGASARSQMLKYHIQTSGRSLHAQEIQFNDIRTTLQALYALFDNCNSLHTNAYDEAITTPTEESVRRAVAIQLIIGRELGLNFCENPLQGSFAIEQLTDLVEEAVLTEFDSLNERGGVLGAMDTMYQRSKIQDESMLYEHMKHDGRLPIVGVNTFLSDNPEAPTVIELARSTEEEKMQQIEQLAKFQNRYGDRTDAVLETLRETARARGNTFEILIDAVKVASLGQLSGALYHVGGQYRRNM